VEEAGDLQRIADRAVQGGRDPLITVAGVAFLAFLGFCIYYWLKDDVYGSNNRDSLLYMGALYLVALAIYVVSRIVRARQGMNLKMVYNEIPAE
jgi:hypothetical protein